jgi:hypothetical protein
VPAWNRVLLDVRPLRESAAFRRLWAGSMVSGLGGSMTDFAVMLQVFRLTHSAFAVGALGLARMIPTLTITMFGGALADTMDRRRLVLATSCCATVLSAVLAAQAIAGLRLLWLLYLLVAAQAAVSSVGAPARRTFTRRLLPAPLLPAGMALSQLTLPVTLLLGPTLAGLIAAAGGLQACYLVDVASFAASLYGVGRLPAMPPQGATADRGIRAVAAGIRFIARSKPLAGAFLADLNATVLGLPVALFPSINAERFGGSPQTLGLLTGAIGAGGLLGLLFSGPVGRVTRPGRGMIAAVALWGLALTGFGAARILWVALACLAIAGAADTFTVVFRGVIVQTAVPEELRGRITAADYVVGYGGGQVGSLESGTVGSLLSPTVSAISGGLGTIAGAVIIGLALPAFTRYRPPGSQDAGAQDDGARDAGPRDTRAQDAAKGIAGQESAGRGGSAPVGV